MKGQVSWFERMAFLAAHPVGEYFWTSSAENPGNKYGGTWTQIKDVFLLAAGDSYAVGSTGGEVKHALTVEETPSHLHDLYGHVFVWGSDVEDVVHIKNAIAEAGTVDANRLYTKQAEWDMTRVTGGNQPHNNMPPYLAAYCWQRTA